MCVQTGGHDPGNTCQPLLWPGELGLGHQVWTSDITYQHSGEGWLYLCVVRDGCSRRMLGWAMDSRQGPGMVEQALTMARTLCGVIPKTWCAMPIGVLWGTSQ